MLLGAECGINADVEKHLELGKKLLAAGQLADALSQFHAAVGLYLGTQICSGPVSQFQFTALLGDNILNECYFMLSRVVGFWVINKRNIKHLHAYGSDMREYSETHRCSCYKYQE